MKSRKLKSAGICLSVILVLSFSTSCEILSGLGETPLVMATAATYTETSQSPPLLKFTIVYWSDDISGLKIELFNPNGDQTKTWEQPAGTLESGDPVVIDGQEVIYGKWRLTFEGTIKSPGDNYGKSFEDEVLVEVTE